MFGFKPVVARPQVSITIDDGEGLRTYDSMSKASLSAGIPYPTLQLAKKKSKAGTNLVPIKSGRNHYVIYFKTI